jgi:signal transduction histidine kinase
MLGAAMMLPAVVTVAWLFREASLREVSRVELQALEAADILVLLTDAHSSMDKAVLQVLSSSPAFSEGDLEAATARAMEVVNAMPGWTALTLFDESAGVPVFQVEESGKTTLHAASNEQPGLPEAEPYGGVEREGEFCPCIKVGVRLPGQPGLVLTAYVDPSLYQDILLQRLPEGAVAALVDQEGEFIARSLDFANRVGTPGTEYVLAAVAAGGRSIYRGVTYEGLSNYTAYATSDVTGWSAHVAISNALIDQPRSQALTSFFIGSLLAILTGVGLFSYVIKDLATRRMEDRRLMELQKAEALSQFTTTIVHDFRNILSAVQAGLRMLLRQSNDAAVISHVELIQGALERGTKLSSRLLSFAREESAAIEALDVAEVLASMDYLLKRAAGQRVDVQVHLPPTQTMIYANLDQFELALINLVVNARDAMDKEGRIEIAVTPTSEHVEVRVSDTGPGVPGEIRTELFKPFFTTKLDGRGTGLGLAQVAAMAEQAGGLVKIEDRVGGGAVFVLCMRPIPLPA